MIKNYNGQIKRNYPSVLDLPSIEAYLKGAINLYLKINSDTWFRVKDLIMSDWNETSLQQIHNYFNSRGLNEKESQKEAAMILGQILKKVIYEDTRLFEMQKEDVNGENYQVTKYKLVN